MNVITKTVQLPDGRTISIETGKVAKQADGAAPRNYKPGITVYLSKGNSKPACSDSTLSD